MTFQGLAWQENSSPGSRGTDTSCQATDIG
nr:MAG TPA: hypothetical protein [Caudoviricetes sp.]